MLGKILVVDDHAPNRELIREALSDSAYEISEAVTASEALELLRYHKTDLVITDVRMPGLSGVELLKRLNKEYPDIVVILMSAFATVAGAVEAMKLGAHDFLTRPLDIDQPRLVIQRAVDRCGVRIDRGSSIDAVERGQGFEDMLGRSKCLLAVLNQATRAARLSLKLRGVIEFLAGAKADIILLQEADLNARRTHHINVAREIARKLQMNYVFGREFQELTQGSKTSPAYHGQATLSRWPLSNSRIIRFRKQSSFWRPHWFLPEIAPFQERLGGRMALISEVNITGKIIVTYNLHLESRGDDQLRCSQLDEALDDAMRYNSETPILLTGDFNLDVSSGPAATAISHAQFQDAFANYHASTTPGSFLEHGRIIDWILARGSVRADQPQAHRSVSASDHYPLSIDLAIV